MDFEHYNKVLTKTVNDGEVAGDITHRKFACEMLINYLITRGDLNREDVRNIRSLMDSPDLENLTVAETLLANINMAGKHGINNEQ